MPGFLSCYGNCTGPFGFPMQEKDARELDKIVKEASKDSAVEYKHHVNGKAFKYFIDDERADVSVVTDGSVDKMREVVSPGGVDFSVFKTNPFVSWNHRYDLMPVGKSIWQTRKGDQWLAKTLFANRPENHPQDKEWEPDTAWHMVKEGFLPAKSIGFFVTKYHEPTKEEKEKSITLKNAEIVFDEVKVYEYAVCTIGCNNNAIVEAVNKGLHLGTALKSLFDFLPEVKEMEEPLLGELPIKVDGLTLEEYTESVRYLVYNRIQGLNPNQLAEDCIARLLGRV